MPLFTKLRISHYLLMALLTCSALWCAFWNTPTSIDQQVLFEQARYLSRFGWFEFLDAVVHRPYVEYQPPFLTFCFSRVPVFWLHQVLLFPFGLLCADVMRRLYGRQAALLCATPVFALMIHQPCTDTILFGLLLMVLQLCQMARMPPHVSHDRPGKRTCTPCTQMRQRFTAFSCGMFSGNSWVLWAAAVLYGLTWMIKPLTILTAPFILPQLGIAGLSSLALWGGYVWWSRQWEFGRHQWQFLLHQLFIKRMVSSRRRTPRPPSHTTRLTQIWRSLAWRWRHIGQNAVIAFPFYMFPAWLRRWTWKGLLLAVMIILGYGNSKYLLLDLLFLFPVHEGDAL
jgi:hypothetical protein